MGVDDLMNHWEKYEYLFFFYVCVKSFVHRI